jgi:hypothetical protein
MLQANQQVVNQHANIKLVEIRQAEISYFTSFFTSFGTQCFLLAGFLAGSVSQTPAFHCATNCVYFWQFLYNLMVSICLALTCMVLLATVFISVFGQGLAIRGPAGSMVDTVQGMVKEQHTIVFLFAWVVATFQAQLMSLFFIVMDWEIAVVCCFFLSLIGYYTYFASMRIYNRFKWDFTKSGWNYDQNFEEGKELSELSPEVLNEIINSSSGIFREKVAQIREAYSIAVIRGMIKESDSNEKKKATILSMIMSGLSTNGVEIAGNNFGVLPSGYLTVKVADPRGSSLVATREKWSEFYFVLKGFYLYYYADKNQFESDRSKSINSRPIDVEGYSLLLDSELSFSLVPVSSDDIRKTWRFKCSSTSDYDFWIKNFSKIIPPADSG